MRTMLAAQYAGYSTLLILAQQRTRIFSLRPLRTTAVLWCAPDALQAAGAAAGAGTVAATLGPSAPAICTPKVRGAPDTGTRSTRGTVSSELKVNVQDVARLCSRKSHVKVGRRLRAVRRLQLGGGWVMGLFGHLGHVVTVPEPPKIRGLKKERRGGIPRRKC